VQRTPPASSRAKSKTHVRLSVQRPLPGAAGVHVTANGGSAARGSPSGTNGSEKRALIWRTFLTLPRGARSTRRGAAPGEVAVLGEFAALTPRSASLFGADRSASGLDRARVSGSRASFARSSCR
jgi:hypothetical protein